MGTPTDHPSSPEFDPHKGLKGHNERLHPVDPPVDYGSELHGKAGQILRKVAGTDEPVFIFRAKDLLATMVLLYYQEQVEKFAPGDLDFEASIVNSVNAFRQWQKDHPHEVRLPD